MGVQSAYVNLGFYYGADLPDPEGLLEGTGKKLRHIKVRKLEEIDEPALQKILHFHCKSAKLLWVKSRSRARLSSPLSWSERDEEVVSVLSLSDTSRLEATGLRPGSLDSLILFLGTGSIAYSARRESRV